MQEEKTSLDINRLESIAQEQLELTRDTNEIVHSIRRLNRISFFTKLLLWALVIVLPLVFIGPILKIAQSFIPTIQLGNESVPIFNIPSAEELQKAFHVPVPQKEASSTPN